MSRDHAPRCCNSCCTCLRSSPLIRVRHVSTEDVLVKDKSYVRSHALLCTAFRLTRRPQGSVVVCTFTQSHVCTHFLSVIWTSSIQQPLVLIPSASMVVVGFPFLGRTPS